MFVHAKNRLTSLKAILTVHCHFMFQNFVPNGKQNCEKLVRALLNQLQPRLTYPPTWKVSAKTASIYLFTMHPYSLSVTVYTVQFLTNHLTLRTCA